MQYDSKTQTMTGVIWMADTIEEAIKLIEKKIKELQVAEQVLRDLQVGAGSRTAAGNGKRKMTNREMIQQVLQEADKPIEAPRIREVLALKGRHTSLNTIRSELSKGKRDGLFENDEKRWTVTDKRK
jgi:hypothetical protein